MGKNKLGQDELNVNNLVESISRSKNQELSTKLLKGLQQVRIEPGNFISQVTLYPQNIELVLSLIQAREKLSSESILELKKILILF